MDGEESKDLEGTDGAHVASGRSIEKILLPGELEKSAPEHDNIIISCAPYHTNKMHEVLPRYNTQIRQVDCEIAGAKEANRCIRHNFQSYFEGMKFKFEGEMAN